MRFLSNLAPNFFSSRNESTGLRLGRQAQLPVHPDFEAIDPSIRPVGGTSAASGEIKVFPKSEGFSAQSESDDSVAAHWAY
jgi:hypothetical protein